MKLAHIVSLVFLLLAACSPNTVSQPTIVPAAVNPTAGTTTTQLGEAPTSSDAAVISRPAWQTMPLVNARTGETFTLADFAGRTVFVEPMATWCTNCRQQMGNVRTARAQLDANQFVFIGLSVETNISAADLATYVDEQGFDWIFAVMTPEILSELTNTFGFTIANPPSTPHFIIRPSGTPTELTTGIESDAQLVQQLTAASAG